MSLYEYVRSRPIVFRDADGRLIIRLFDPNEALHFIRGFPSALFESALNTATAVGRAGQETAFVAADLLFAVPDAISLLTLGESTVGGPYSQLSKAGANSDDVVGLFLSVAPQAALSSPFVAKSTDPRVSDDCRNKDVAALSLLAQRFVRG